MLFTLSNAFGASGREQPVSVLAAKMLEPYVDSVSIDKLGNVVGYKSCKKPHAKKIMLDAHLDQVSLIVSNITDEGFIRFHPLSIDPRMLPAGNVVIDAAAGPVRGTVISIPPHIQTGDTSKAYKFEELCIDIGFTKEQAEKLVSVGDFIYYDNDATDIGNLLCGKAMDDRACFVSILHALELIKDKELDVDLVVVGSTKEEVGGHGAQARTYLDKPDLAIILDVNHVKTPDAPKQFEIGSPIISIGAGSTPKYARQILEVARAKNIKTQIEILTSVSPTNAYSMQIVNEGIPCVAVALGLKYMHSPVEAISLGDIKSLGKLISEYLLNINNRFN